MRGPCACPGWGGLALASDARPTPSHPHQDKHKAPTLPRVRPLSLQDEDAPPPFPNSVVTIHQDGGRLLPDSVVTIHQDENTPIAGFDRENSLENDATAPVTSSDLRVLSSVEITSTLLAVLPERKTGQKNAVLCSAFAYTWNRLKRYHHAHRMGDAGFDTKRTTYAADTDNLKRIAERHHTL